MIYILGTIVSSALIYILFRVAKNYNCNLTGLISLNYFVATLLGILLFTDLNFNFFENVKSWLPFGIILGTFFIAMFYLIGVSSQKAGITITTLANKLSLVFPVLFSIIYFNESITTYKYIGIASSLFAIALTVYKKDIKSTNLLFIVLPLAIFIGSGITDSIVKYAQAVVFHPNYAAQFSTLVFMVAFIIALLISITQNKKIKINTPTLLIGILLGLVNFGSLYFLINALNKSSISSSLVFAIVNMSIVSISAIAGVLFFKEKFSKLNILGIVLAIVSLYFLM